MKKLIYASSLLLITSLTGCGTTAYRIDPAGNESLVSIDDINIKDWQKVAEKSINSLLESGTIKNPNRKSIVMVTPVKNSTSKDIETRILTDKIRHAIMISQQASITNAVGGNGPDDKSVGKVRELVNDPNFNKKTVQPLGTVLAPDFSLIGEIVESKSKEGRHEESYFFFHVSVTDLKTGLSVWEENVEVAKRGKKSMLADLWNNGGANATGNVSNAVLRSASSRIRF